MINALHLLWIVPLAAGLGAVGMAIFSVGGNFEPDSFDNPDNWEAAHE